MKKVISILIAALLCGILIIEASAAETKEDSLYVAPEIREKITRVSTDGAIKLFHGQYMLGFAAEATITDLLEDPYTICEYYVCSDMLGRAVWCREIVNGEAVHAIPRGENIYYAVATDPGSVLYSLGPLVTVQEIYCLNGLRSDGGLYVYFVTNIGDYIYHRSLSAFEDEYLMPVEDFYEYAKAAWEYRSSLDPQSEGRVLYTDSYDLSKYQVTSISLFHRILMAAIPGILLLSLGIWLLVHRKKKTHLTVNTVVDSSFPQNK